MEHSVARIRDAAGVVVGSGFLIGPGLLCTCAHVIAQAVGADPRASSVPSGSVTVDFPLAGADVVTGTPTVVASVIRWVPVRDDETGDLAVLRLHSAAPGGARPARLRLTDGHWDESVRLVGFPAGQDAGVWVSGRLRGRQATGWVQFEVFDGPRVAAGFSGGPVWSNAAAGVIGMVIAAQRGAGTAYLVPLRTILDDQLLAEVLPECPYRGLEAFQEQDAAIFFGRRREAERLAEYAAHRRLVVVSGRSGSGKSSLVRAALWPRLRAKGCVIVDQTASSTPPLEQLVNAVVPLLGERRAAQLRDAPVGEIGQVIAKEHDRSVLFFDQFEEVVAAEPAIARELVALLVGLVSGIRPRPGRPPALQVVLTLRSTDIDEVFTAEHAEMLDDGSVRVLPMGRDDLRSAIVEPVRSVGLVDFEPGLVDRIVAEARESPGQLALVQFALTRLWEDQRGGLLTHRAYEEIGQVAGAIAAYAETVYAHQLTTEADRDLARRLLVRLARPAEDGSFVLAPTRLDQLGPQLAELAGRLSSMRLVVIRHDLGQPPMAALAHHALISHWGTLRDWLIADRDYLVWQTRLRSNLAAWHAAGEDPGGLLRGNQLMEAETWAARRPESLTDAERRYLTASTAAARRGIRRWRMVTAVIAILALATAGFAAVTRVQSEQLSDRLRQQIAVSLARESTARFNSQSAMSLQLAQAAVRHDPTSGDARAALLMQQVRFADQRWIRPPGWSKPLNAATTDADGSVIVLGETDGTVTVWFGLLGGEPTSWRVTSAPKLSGVRVSDDGSRLAVFGERGEIDVWDVARRTGPLRLRPPMPAGELLSTASLSAEFAPDGRSLVVLDAVRDTGQPDRVEVYDTVSGQRRRSAINLDGTAEVTVLGLEPGARLVRLREYTRDGRSHTVVRQVAGGAVVRELPEGLESADGSIVDCAPRTNILTIIGVTGAVRSRTRLSDCSRAVLDHTRRYLLQPNGSGSSAFQLVTIVDVKTGRTYQTSVPHVPRTETTATSLVLVTPGPDGPELTTIAERGVTRSRPAVPRDEPALFAVEGYPSMTINHDGTLAAAYFRKPEPGHAGLEVYALPAQRRLAGGPGSALAHLDLRDFASDPTFTPDGRFLLAVAANDDLIAMSTVDYVVHRRMRLPLPPGNESFVRPTQWNLSVVPQPDDEVIVLYAGGLTRWRVSTGERLSGPLPLTGDPTQLREDGQKARAMARPGHPGQVLVSMRDGVQLWDVPGGRMIDQFRPEVNSDIVGVLPDANSEVIAVHVTTSLLYLWDPDRDQPASGRDQPAPDGASPLPADQNMIAFGPGDILVVEGETAGSIALWDAQVGRVIARLDLPSYARSWRVVDGMLLGITGDGVVRLNLDRDRGLDQLCGMSDRPYTVVERRLLPPGADDAPPCRAWPRNRQNH